MNWFPRNFSLTSLCSLGQESSSSSDSASSAVNSAASSAASVAVIEAPPLVDEQQLRRELEEAVRKDMEPVLKEQLREELQPVLKEQLRVEMEPSMAEEVGAKLEPILRLQLEQEILLKLKAKMDEELEDEKIKVAAAIQKNWEEGVEKAFEESIVQREREKMMEVSFGGKFPMNYYNWFIV